MKTFPLILAGLGLLTANALADFTISTAVGSQTLSGGTGTVTSTGSISVATGTGLTLSGTSIVSNAGLIQNTGSGRAIRNTANGATLTLTNTGTISGAADDAMKIADSAISLTTSGTISAVGGQALDWRDILTKSNSLINQSTGRLLATGEDAVRPGVNGTIENAGEITATPTGTTSPSGSDGVDAGINTGVQITNTGSISGRHGVTGGVNSGSFGITVTNNAGTISGVNGSGINIDGVFTSVTTNVTNALGATIQGGVLAASTNGDGDGVDVDGVLTLENSGDILGYGAKGVGSDTLPNNAEGIAAGGGTIINTATGRIIGSTLIADAPNGDSTREGHGILVDDSSGGGAIAATTITNSGLIQGKTGYGIRIIGTFADTITNNASGTIRGAGTGAAIQTGGGNDSVTNRGAVIGDNGTAIDLEAGNDSLTIEGSSASVTGNISGGSGTNTLTVNPGAGNTFAYSDTITNFESLDVQSGTFTVNGPASATVTNLTVDGPAELRFNVTGLDRGLTYASINITGLLTLSGSVRVVSGYAFGLNDTLNLFDFGSLDLTAFSLGTDLILPTLAPQYSWDLSQFATAGSVMVVPEPSAWALMLLAGLAWFGLGRKRAQRV